MELVKTKTKNFSDYNQYLDVETKLEFEFYRKWIAGKKVAMVSATSYGGGVAELLHSFVPLAQDFGIKMDWWVIHGAKEFYEVTKDFHNCLQGKDNELTLEAQNTYLGYNELNSQAIQDWDYDYVVIHDPQPAALIDYRSPLDRAKWIWRCHIDTSTPNPQYWDFLHEYIKKYDACIFTMKEYVKDDAEINKLTIIAPTIDPLSIKNTLLDNREVNSIVEKFGIDIKRPLITQISRFDPWKDPLGVIEVYKHIKRKYLDVQLALVGSMASDDPEGWDFLYQTLRYAGVDNDIKIMTNFNGVADREVNAFQRASNIIIQKSIREGFGLTVSEGLWKGRPVIGGNAGGIKLQIDDGANGFIVNDINDCIEKTSFLLENPNIVHEMGIKGREKVRKHFLITRGLLDYLKLFDLLLKEL